MADLAFRLTLLVSPFGDRACDGLVQTDHRMAVTCEASEGLSPKIFAYIRKGRLNWEGNYETYDEFDHVCSPTDMVEYPEDAPLEGDNPAWYRRADIDLIVRHMALVGEVWDNIKQDVDLLEKLIREHNELVPMDIHTAGNPEALQGG